jgi:hypothetical protein
MGGILATATGCPTGLATNNNLSGDACSQLSQAFEALNARMTGCGFTAGLELTTAQCESMLSSCGGELSDGGGDVPGLIAAADCVNQIQGGDCSTYPNLAADATVAFTQDCFAADTAYLSNSCQLIDAGTSVLSDGPLIGGAPELLGYSPETALVSWGSDMEPGASGANVCPTPSTTLLGTSTTTCKVDGDCAPICCNCVPDAGPEAGSYLAAACMNGQCIPPGWVCNVVNEQVNAIEGVGVCSDLL